MGPEQFPLTSESVAQIESETQEVLAQIEKTKAELPPTWGVMRRFAEYISEQADIPAVNRPE